MLFNITVARNYKPSCISLNCIILPLKPGTFSVASTINAYTGHWSVRAYVIFGAMWACLTRIIMQTITPTYPNLHGLKFVFVPLCGYPPQFLSTGNTIKYYDMKYIHDKENYNISHAMKKARPRNNCRHEQLGSC